MKTIISISLLIGMTLLPATATAQILDVRRAVKNKVVNKVNNQIDNAIDKQLNKVENAVVDSINKKNTKEAGVQTSGEGETATGSGAGQEVQEDAADQAQPASAPQEKASLQTYSKYDFIPGEKVIFFDDFAQDVIGDFPALWNTNGSGEIVSNNLFPGKWFQIKDPGFYIPDTQGDFPENFTVEFDWITAVDDERPSIGFSFTLVSGNPKDPAEGGAIPGAAGVRITLEDYRCAFDSYAEGAYTLSGGKDLTLVKDTRYRVSIWVQKQRLRVYINENKTLDVPRAMPAGYKYNIVRYDLSGYTWSLISNFRVAAGLPDMRSKLLTEGKLVTYGLYFDVNSDQLKPESYGTLKGIATVLTENPDVKVKIIGHTDSDGNDAANLDLSKRRAAAVRNELIKGFAIDGSRMETDGKGETQPVAPNDNSTNKALNRRVEFIKL